jgi:hypothetical protein
MYFHRHIRFQIYSCSSNLCFCKKKIVVRSMEEVKLQINLVSEACKYIFFRETDQVYQPLDFKHDSSVHHSTSLPYILQLRINNLHIVSYYKCLKLPFSLIRENAVCFYSCWLYLYSVAWEMEVEQDGHHINLPRHSAMRFGPVPCPFLINRLPGGE